MRGREKEAVPLASYSSYATDEYQRPRRREQSRRLLLVRGVGIFLLCIPLALLLLCAAVYFYGIEFPEPEAHAKAVKTPSHEYLSLYPAVNNKHHVPGPTATEDPVGHADGHKLISNGTHWFRPTLILVSLDGFRADYLQRGISPSLVRIGKQGLRADYMIPSFPSSTFPNHYTIVTGLYPGSHGIVNNIFYDSQLNDTFVFKDSKKNIDSRWWEGGEPIWVTAEKQGLKAGIDMWPGSTAVIKDTRPSYVVPYSNDVHPTEKTQQLLEWLDLPLDRRPAFLATYMPEVDQAAHKLGPDAKKVDEAIHMVDEALGDLWAEIGRRNLTHVVNLMVVSDHGMAASRAHKNAIYIDDIIDVSKLRGIYGWPLGGIEPLDSADVPEMFRKLKIASHGQPWKVYLRDEIPARFHYTYQTRIAPIYVIPEVPYYVTTHETDNLHAQVAAARSSGNEDRIMGVHGYDNLHPLMRATFVATGPAFRSRHQTAPALSKEYRTSNVTLDTDSADPDSFVIQRKADYPSAQNGISMEQIHDDGSRISDMSAEQDYLDLVRSALVSSRPIQNAGAEYDMLWGESHMSENVLRNIRHPPFENVELYGLMTSILGLKPAPNNGTSEFSRWWLHQQE
ncbi:hypothetical protein J3B02_003326 [Coemansia erecta]|uniref:Uncharacterized protein n=1 Tax=Coemansia asiatica TaxID=1052880 RepID=A0A9W8CIA1_9FUNG|nr:hypothetical protein LPJ64_004003 [Coemansia asiatica]KAJ2853005.1 hypothetical protein J3B02_003326 [Coemansia erecta]KAJ2879390.1 hypothetical protein FB639_003098 [Coemansia asiatica]